MDALIGAVAGHVHVVEVVRREQAAPVGQDLPVAALSGERPDLLRRFERGTLQVVPEPGAEVAVLIGPAHRVRHADRGPRGTVDRFVDRRPPELGVVGDLAGERAQEFEDSRRGGVVLAERLEVHEQADQLARRGRDPSGVLLGGQRELVPSLRREAEPDVVAQRVVPEEQADGRRGAAQ